MASTQSLQCITGCLLFSAQVRYFQPRCVDMLATGKGPSPSHRWLSFVCTLLRFFRAPGPLPFHSGAAREGNSASLHCAVGALAKVSFGSVLAALRCVAPLSQWHQKSQHLCLLPGMRLPIPSTWRIPTHPSRGSSIVFYSLSVPFILLLPTGGIACSFMFC